LTLHWLTAIFLFAVFASTALHLWLNARQIREVLRHRESVPHAFAASISLDDHRKAAEYTVARARLGRIDTVLDCAILLALTLGGGISWIDAQWSQAPLAPLWHAIAVILSVLLVVTAAGLPLSIYGTFAVEARFGFNRTTPLLFVADLLKSLLVTLLIGVPLLAAILLFMQKSGDWWWVWAWAAWVTFTLFITWAWPSFIAPLFNKFSALSDAQLQARVEALLKRCGFTSRGLFVMDGSRRSTHGNAYFTGMGRNKRIVFFDTLLERLGHTEVEAVLAHELGHFRLHHVRQRLIMTVAAGFAGLALLGWLMQWPDFYTALGVASPSPHTALLLFMFALSPFMFFLTPLLSAWSRLHEFQADRFAAEYASARELASALVKLFRDNASTLTPDALHSRFFDSHPPALQRIARLHELASSSGPGSAMTP
jgi:STE24 endopeptidase